MEEIVQSPTPTYNVEPEDPENNESLKPIQESSYQEDEKSQIFSINPILTTTTQIGIKIIKIINTHFPNPDSSGINRKFSTIAKHRLGLPILKHLEEFHAFTYLELEYNFGEKRSNIHYVVQALRNLGIVKVATKISKKGASTGNSPKVWIEVSADPDFSRKAIKRYFQVLGRLQKYRGNEEEIDEAKVDECVQWIIDYLEQRDLTRLGNHVVFAKFVEIDATVGERREIYRRIKERGFDVWR